MTRKPDIKWVLKETVISIHDMLISEHGGSSGIRDEGLLDSALARPKNVYNYNEGSSIFEQAASLGYSLIKNHPFVDGNKRIALTITAVFLDLNVWELNASEAEAVLIFTDLAAGSLDEREFSLWLDDNCIKNT
ncbi:MAG TPA: type II toxin-antitoxin system death-on-curing family toxin [Thermodesulfobacteriota bacterium]|nr:type II toxin-antitoxin system death-on-curing family toxin [Thermodesulfobacteriota bacterium]